MLYTAKNCQLVVMALKPKDEVGMEVHKLDQFFRKECEEMAFSPWNALAEHRPMGGINWLRQAVYLANQAKRGAEYIL